MSTEARELEVVAEYLAETRCYEPLALLSVKPALASWFAASTNAHLTSIHAAIMRQQVLSALELLQELVHIVGSQSSVFDHAVSRLTTLLRALHVLQQLSSGSFDFGHSLCTINRFFPHGSTTSGSPLQRELLLRALDEATDATGDAERPTTRRLESYLTAPVIWAAFDDLCRVLRPRTPISTVMSAARANPPNLSGSDVRIADTPSSGETSTQSRTPLRMNAMMLPSSQGSQEVSMSGPRQSPADRATAVPRAFATSDSSKHVDSSEEIIIGGRPGRRVLSLALESDAGSQSQARTDESDADATPPRSRRKLEEPADCIVLIPAMR